MVTPVGTGQEPLKLCFAEIEDVTIAFRADSIECFLEEREHSLAPDIDLLEVLRLNADTTMTSRRRALVATDRGPLEVAVGSRLSLRTIAHSEVLPLPALIESLAAHTGLAGVFELSGRFTFLLDLQRIPRSGDDPSAALPAPREDDAS